ncbi:MAG: family 16 glycoside hydrolase [Planctomycetota bacterium]
MTLVRTMCAALFAVAAPQASSAAQDPAAAPAPGRDRLRVLVVTGANNHDWEWTAPRLRDLLVASGRFEVDVTEDPTTTLADADGLERYAAFVLDYNGPRWGEAAESAFLARVRAGAGVTVVHAANNAFPGWRDYEEVVALCWRKGTGHGRFHAFDVAITDRNHPITAGMPDMVGHPDELYHRLVHMHGATHRVLATAHSATETGGSGRDEPMIIVREEGAGRVFHTPLGHVWRKQPKTHASFADPQLQWLLARGTEWAATGAVTLPVAVPNHLSAEERAAGFRLLFDGTSTAGWRGFRKPGVPEGWTAAHGSLVCLSGGGDLVTEEQFGDFDLRFEWAVAPGGNSGVIYRCTEEEKATYRTGPEYQVLDDAALGPEPLHAAAALYGLYVAKGAEPRPAGLFNQGRIVVRDGRVEHWLNGVRVVDARLDDQAWRDRVAGSKFGDMPGFGRASRGHIALQDHGANVWYRSLRIRPFP